MPVALKVALLAIVGVVEAAMGLVMWRRFMAEGRSRLAVFMAAQAIATVLIFAMILFVFL
jgi:hypothetical protein